MPKRRETSLVLPEVRDVSELERSVVIVRRRGDLEKAYADAKYAAQSAREDAQTALKALPLWSGTLEALESLPLPPEKTIDEFEEAFDAVDDGLRKAREGLAETKGKIEEIDGNLRTLKLSGEPPTEEDLTAARDHRERGWALVRSAWLDGKRDEAAEAALDPPLPLEQAYEKSVLNADGVADRMRREAERVAHKAGLLADREAPGGTGGGACPAKSDCLKENGKTWRKSGRPGGLPQGSSRFLPGRCAPGWPA